MHSAERVPQSQCLTVASYYNTLMSEHSTAALEGVREQHSRGQQKAEGDGGKIQIPSKNSYF